MIEPNPPRADADEALVRRLEEAWRARYFDPSLMTEALHTAADSSEHRIMRAFDAWRRHHHDDALQLLTGLDTEVLALRWVARAHNLRGVILYDIGLQAESLQCHLEELEDAQALGDPVAESGALHDLGLVYSRVDPPNALSYYLAAVELAQSFRGGPGTSDKESQCIEALAIVNISNLECDHALGIDPAHMDLERAEELARVGWPELAEAIRAKRAMRAIDDGDVERARALLADAADPESMRDASNAQMIIEAKALLAASEGRHADAVAPLEAALATAPPSTGIELLDLLVDIHEQAGDLRAALDASRRRQEVASAFHEKESQATVRALEVWFRTRTAEEEVRRAVEQARDLRERLEALDRDREAWRLRSRRDPLTGLWNRTYLLEVIDLLGPDTGHQVAVIDVDRFKSINDTRGHGVGDDALIAVAQALESAASPRDTCARYGGDEFVVIRPDAVLADLAVDLQAVTHIAARPDAGLPAVTTSIGVTVTTPEGFPKALDVADRAMYAAKRLGGGRIVVHEG